MKVGALALLREGRTVVMHTAQEKWTWARAVDPSFAVRVLTIFVSPREPLNGLDRLDDDVPAAAQWRGEQQRRCEQCRAATVATQTTKCIESIHCAWGYE